MVQEYLVRHGALHQSRGFSLGLSAPRESRGPQRAAGVRRVISFGTDFAAIPAVKVKVAPEQPDNVSVARSDSNGVPLDAESIDVAMIKSSAHLAPRKGHSGLLADMHRVLTTGWVAIANAPNL